ncbi:MAG: VTT domain-containing protein [Oscillospiraceae bacterium]
MIDKSKLKRYSNMFFRALPIIIILAITITMFYFKDDLTVEQMLNYAPKSIPLSILFFLVMYACKSLSFVFPIALLIIASGTIFNAYTAVIVNTIGSVISLSIPYFIGKFSSGNSTEKLVEKYQKLKALDTMQKDNNFFFSYIARVIGVLPFDAVSMYMGLAGITYPQYISGSILGFLPRIIATTLIGMTLTDPTSPAFILSCVFNILLAGVSILIYKNIIKKHSQQKENKT